MLVKNLLTSLHISILLVIIFASTSCRLLSDKHHCKYEFSSDRGVEIWENDMPIDNTCEKLENYSSGGISQQFGRNYIVVNFGKGYFVNNV